MQERFYEVFLYHGDSDNGDKLGEIYATSATAAIDKLTHISHKWITVVGKCLHEAKVEMISNTGDKWVYTAQVR
jgi:hypothetical protein